MSDGHDRQDGAAPLEIEVEGLRKTFGRREVLKGISFGVRARRLPQHLRPQRGRQDDDPARARHAAHAERRQHQGRRPRRARGSHAGARRHRLHLAQPDALSGPHGPGEPALLRRHVRRGGPRGAHHRAAGAPRAHPPPLRRRAHLQQGHAPAARHRARHPAPPARAAARRAALRPRPARRRHPRRPARRDPRRAHLRHGDPQHRQGPGVGDQADDRRGRPHRLRACGRRRPESFSAVYREHVQEGAVL